MLVIMVKETQGLTISVTLLVEDCYLLGATLESEARQGLFELDDVHSSVTISVHVAEHLADDVQLILGVTLVDECQNLYTR